MSQYDPGIVRTVEWLRRMGFTTTESGDGVSKPPETRTLDRPHVFMRVEPPHKLIAEARRLATMLSIHFEIQLMPVGQSETEPSLECSFDPTSNVAIMALVGVADADLTERKPYRYPYTVGDVHRATIKP